MATKHQRTTDWTVVVVRRLASESDFLLGQDMQAHGYVLRATHIPGGVEATVRDRIPAKARVWQDEGFPDYECTCDAGQKGVFCCHCVAAAMALIANPKDPAAMATRRARKPTTERVRDALLAEDHEALVNRVLAWAQEDKSVAARLWMIAASSQGPMEEWQALRGEIDRNLKPVARRKNVRVRDVQVSIRQVLRLLQDLTARSRWATAAVASVYCLERVWAAVPDQPTGHVLLQETFRDLVQLHLQACTHAPPSGTDLARVVLDLFTGTFGVPLSSALTDYEQLLGKDGKADLKRLVKGHFDEFPHLKPGEGRLLSYRREKIQELMEQIVASQGDLDLLGQTIAKDLSGPDRFAKIATVYEEQEQFPMALQWALRGIADCHGFSLDETDPLRQIAIECYLELGEHSKVEKLLWRRFQQQPSLELLTALQELGEIVGNAKVLRANAIAHVTGRLELRRKDVLYDPSLFPARHYAESGMLDIFVAVGDSASALEAFRLFGATPLQVISLANMIVADNPQFAAELFLQAAERAIRNPYGPSYAEMLIFVLNGLRLSRKQRVEALYLAQMARFVNKYRRVFGFEDALRGSSAIARLGKEGKFSL